MIKKIRLVSAEDLRRFMNLAWECPEDVGVHTTENQIADAKSVLGLMALDYSKPVMVVTESESFLKTLEREFRDNLE